MFFNLQFGGITWTVTLGRRDGIVSSVTEGNSDLPPPFANFTQLVSMFAKKGLTMKDMVILSGGCYPRHKYPSLIHTCNVNTA